MTTIAANSQDALDILVVEDNPSDFYLLSEYLNLSGIQTREIRQVDKVREALEVLEHFIPDLIFLDLTLPDSEGLNTFNTINSHSPNISIIILSGLSDKKIAIDTIVLGAQDYLVKGEFDERLLYRSVQYSIERKKILQKVVENYERYKTLIRATNDTVWDWDLRNSDVTWNEGILKTFGYAEENMEFSFQWHINNIHPEDRTRIAAKIELLIKKGEGHWQEEYRYRCSDGSYREVYDRGYVLKNEKGTPYRMIGAMMDVTERKQLQESLMRNRLEEQKLINQITIQTQERERGEIGRELHDNINQILAAAKMYVDMAMHQKHARQVLLYLGHDNISKAIQEIRSLSKTLVPPSLGEISLQDAIFELVNSLNVLNELQISFKTEGKDLNLVSEGHKLILYRIVQEQMNNIIKHSKASKAQLLLRVEETLVHLSITDNGVGFDPASKTSGIGLKNISSRVEMNNGRMTIISAPGKGCRLQIEIPLA